MTAAVSAWFGMKFTAESILNVAWLHQVAGFPSAGVVVAVSGGLDSMALLHALQAWCGDDRARCLHVAHLDHGLRGAAAAADAQLVAETAAQMGLDWTVEHADIPHLVASGGNLEAVARQVRYAFLRRTAERLGAAFVATAHTQSDQAETVLLRLVRGTSLAGLTAIAPLRPLAAGTPVQVIRPLLGTSRRQIVAYAQHHGVPFREDATNRDLARARNRLRQRVLPELERLNPQVGSALARLAAQAREDQQYLMEIARSWLERHARRAGGRLALPVMELLALPPPIRRRVLHAVAQQAEYPAVASRHVAAIEQTLLPTDAIGKCVELTGGRQVRRIADALVFTQA